MESLSIYLLIVILLLILSINIGISGTSSWKRESVSSEDELVILNN